MIKWCILCLKTPCLYIKTSKSTYTKLQDLPQKCKGVNNINTLVSFSNDNDLTSLIKASICDSSCTLQNISHDETNLTNKMGPRLNKKIEVKFQISCGSYLSNYAALAGKGKHFRKVNNINDYVKKNKSYLCI